MALDLEDSTYGIIKIAMVCSCAVQMSEVELIDETDRAFISLYTLSTMSLHKGSFRKLHPTVAAALLVLRTKAGHDACLSRRLLCDNPNVRVTLMSRQ